MPGRPPTEIFDRGLLAFPGGGGYRIFATELHVFGTGAVANPARGIPTGRNLRAHGYVGYGTTADTAEPRD